MISVICVYNNKTNLEKQLIKSLNSFEKNNYELILVDSIKYQFRCSADALNYGAKQANGSVFIFTHQDIFIKNEKQFYEFCDFIERHPTGTIVGAAGVVERDKTIYGNYTTGFELQPEEVKMLHQPMKVACVDESFFGMSKETYERHNFDNILCDNWHLYAVEMSLHAREKGSEVYVYPIEIHHFSNGTISKSYMKGLLKIADRYRKSFKYIWTCCYKVDSSWIYTRSLYIVWYLHRLLVGKSLK